MLDGFFQRSGWFVRTGIADLIEGSFDQVFSLFADVVIDGGHRLDRASGRSGECELAVDDLTLVQREWAVAENDKAAVGEGATFVFMEIKHDFFVGEGVFGNFHWGYRGNGFGWYLTASTNQRGDS